MLFSDAARSPARKPSALSTLEGSRHLKMSTASRCNFRQIARVKSSALFFICRAPTVGTTMQIRAPGGLRSGAEPKFRPLMLTFASAMRLGKILAAAAIAAMMGLGVAPALRTAAASRRAVPVHAAQTPHVIAVEGTLDR